MEWIKTIDAAVKYIESHITDDLTSDNVAKKVHVSPFYFQKGFSMLCGLTVSEYVRNRRLTLAGQEITFGNDNILNVAVKYGYDSVGSFTKAFTRFHGVTPVSARKDNVMLKTFAPLKIRFSLEGGYLMDYKIVNEKAFTVIGNAKRFIYEEAKEKVPEFWREHFASGKGATVMGTYGVNIDAQMGGETFEYLIADPYKEGKDVPCGFVLRKIPALTWAIFPCVGPMPKALQDVNKRIFSEWLPSLTEYEFAAGYCIEYYDDPSKYEKGTLDDKYYCEIRVPVKKKK